MAVSTHSCVTAYRVLSAQMKRCLTLFGLLAFAALVPITSQVRAMDANSPNSSVGPNTVSNPISPDVTARIRSVLVGSLGEQNEIDVIDTIKDSYRVDKLRERLSNPTLIKKQGRGFVSRVLHLIFLDDHQKIVAAASYYFAHHQSFVLHPAWRAYERSGHYYIDTGRDVLPGRWDPTVDYSAYVIPFDDWAECIGYTPGW
jgi:hypothetical protein